MVLGVRIQLIGMTSCLILLACAGCSVIGINHQSNRGIQFYQAGEYIAAGEVFEQLLQGAPGHVNARLYQGWTLYFQKHSMKSANTFGEVLALPELSVAQQADAWHGLARNQFFLQNYTQASESARLSLDLVPENLGLWLVLGWSELYNGRYPESEKAFIDALNLESNNYEAWQGIAWCAYYQGEYPRALQFIKRAKKSGCPEEMIQELRNWCYEATGTK